MTTPALTREQKASRFRAIVDRRARMSLDWQLTPEGGEIVARLIAAHPLEPVLTFDVNADAADISAVAAFPADLDFLIDIVREQGARLRSLEPKSGKDNHPETARVSAPRKPYSAAQNCAMHGSDRLFQRYMHEVHGLDHPEDATRMRTKIHGLLSIASRADLDTDPTAAARWHDLRAHFNAWKELKL